MIEYHLNPPNDIVDTIEGRILVIDFARPMTPREVDDFTWKKVATSLPNDKLVYQIQESNSICIIGGDTLRLINTLKPIEGWIEALSGKRVYAWSAGVSCLAMMSWNVDYKKIVRGFGLIPFKTIVHYTDFLHDAAAKLALERPVHIPILTFYAWSYVSMTILDNDEINVIEEGVD